MYIDSTAFGHFFRKIKWFLIIFVLAGDFLAFILYLVSPPAFVKDGISFNITKGESLSTVSQILKENKLIRSQLIFKLLAIFSGQEKNIQAGAYYFEEPRNAFYILSRLRGGTASVKIVIPEGTSVSEIPNIAEKQIADFDAEHFLEIALPLEGYLFPDTYFLSVRASPEEVVRVMRENFKNKISSLNTKNKDLKSLIIMASLVEEEARTPPSRKIISGILWKRLKNEMSLQVDASVMFAIGKTSGELTSDDLQLVSPYNTYKFRGLPPTPISNPGLDSINAALNPEETPYWYYLSDSDSEMHYASTYEEHLINREMYLKK